MLTLWISIGQLKHKVHPLEDSLGAAKPVSKRNQTPVVKKYHVLIKLTSSKSQVLLDLTPVVLETLIIKTKRGNFRDSSSLLGDTESV